MAKRNRWGRKLGDLCKTKGNGSASVMESARLIGGGPLTLDHIASGKRLAVIQRYPPLTTVGIIERDCSISFIRFLRLVFCFVFHFSFVFGGRESLSKPERKVAVILLLVLARR